MLLGEEQTTSVRDPQPVIRPSTRTEEELSRVEGAVEAAVRHLFSQQREDGHWCAELEGDTILESEYLLGLYFLGRSGEERARKAANYLRQEQLAEGGWAIYPKGPPEISASVKAYFVLKLMGDNAQAPHMKKAREAILRLGGLDACNSFTKLYLSIFGQYEWRHAPAVPPELVLLPRWFYLNLYEMSSWSRAIVVPLSIIWACKPSCPVPAGADVGELRIRHRHPSQDHSPRERLWSLFFRWVDWGIKGVEALRLTPFRQRALRKAEAWVRQRLDQSDGLGAIFPSILNTVIALRSLGYEVDDPLVKSQMLELEKLEIEEENSLRVQPCFSPVWDTALSMNALLEAGVGAEHSSIVSAARWLLEKEVRQVGDWQLKNPEGEPGGWFFEYANEFYPDCDDTAEVLAGLSQLRLSSRALEKHRLDAVERALKWQLSMQNRDGGWAAFDKGCDRQVLTLVPFADHNAMIDPSTTDITGRTLEALACLGMDREHPVVKRAIAFLYREQEEDGSWYGRWGSNYIYGTWLALAGLKAAGEDLASGPGRRAINWLLVCQNPDGGWGESLRSYDESSLKGKGESSAAQTAWAMMGLLADDSSRNLDSVFRVRITHALRNGARYLLTTQEHDGSWHDSQWTGTGFPKVFYLRYHLYSSYFPLQALAQYRRALEMACGVNRAA